VKLNFALVGLTALGSESLAKLFRDNSRILTSVEPSPTTSVDQPNTDKTVLEDNVIETEGDGANATTAEQPRSVLDGLNLDTAIRLRWALRDIKAKRTKFSPVGQDDLMAMIELGLIEMQNDEPALTNEGMRAIAYSTRPDEGERGEYPICEGQSAISPQNTKSFNQRSLHIRNLAKCFLTDDSIDARVRERNVHRVALDDPSGILKANTSLRFTFGTLTKRKRNLIKR